MRCSADGDAAATVPAGCDVIECRAANILAIDTVELESLHHEIRDEYLLDFVQCQTDLQPGIAERILLRKPIVFDAEINPAVVKRPLQRSQLRWLFMAGVAGTRSSGCPLRKTAAKAIRSGRNRNKAPPAGCQPAAGAEPSSVAPLPSITKGRMLNPLCRRPERLTDSRYGTPVLAKTIRSPVLANRSASAIDCTGPDAPWEFTKRPSRWSSPGAIVDKYVVPVCRSGGCHRTQQDRQSQNSH